MRRVLALGLTLSLALAGSADAWLIAKPVTPYVGPGDIVSGATVFYGLRAYSAAIAAAGTQKIVDLQRSSDSATCTALIGTSGGVDLTVGKPCASGTQTVTAWAGADTLSATKWYNQTAVGPDLGVAGLPTFHLPGAFCANLALPCISLSGSSQNFIVNTSLTSPVAQPNSESVVAELLGGAGDQDVIFETAGAGGAGPQQFLTFFSSPNTVRIRTDSKDLSTTATDNQIHAFNVLFSGASSVINVDGTETTGDAGTTAAPVLQLRVGSIGATHTLNGVVNEAGFWPVGFSAGQRTSLCASQHAYWGISGTC